VGVARKLLERVLGDGQFELERHVDVGLGIEIGSAEGLEGGLLEALEEGEERGGGRDGHATA